MVIGILVEWDGRTGQRAGAVNPRDPNLPCRPDWQNMDVTPHLEIRILKNEKDLPKYQNTPGITILMGEEAINDALDEYFPPKLIISDEFLFQQHVKQKLQKGDLDLDKFSDGINMEGNLPYLKKQGIKGISEKGPEKL